MKTAELFKTVQFVVGPNGQPLAAQIGIHEWEALLDWLEDLEDRAQVKAVLPKLASAQTRAKALRWVEVRAEWGEDDDDL